MPPPSRWPAPILLPDGLDDCDAPDALVCPITQELMTEPALVTTSGRTFQRDAITRWVNEHGTDPLRRNEPLTVRDLAPNLAVRQMVEQWAREQNGGTLPPQPTEPGPVRAEREPPEPESNSGPEQRELREEDLFFPDRMAQQPLTNLPDEHDPVESGTLRVLGTWNRPGTPLGVDGKFFRFDAERVGRMIENRFGTVYAWNPQWSSVPQEQRHVCFVGSRLPPPTDRGNVKNGSGAVLRCVNMRTGKSDAVCLFDVGADGTQSIGGVGGWNPFDYAAEDDFRLGDVLLLPDLVTTVTAGEANFRTLVPSEITKNTGTGWNLDGVNCLFGKCGVVGDWWKELELEFTFASDTLVAGIYTDAPVDDTPVDVYVLERAEWRKIRTRRVSSNSVQGASTFVFVDKPRMTKKIRARWESTDLHKLGGLSTARSGGGVHAHPVGPPTAVTEGLAGGLAGLSIGSSSGATSSSLAPVAVVSNQPSVQAESDGWWSPNAVQATEISRAARASLQDQPQSGTRFPNV